MMSGLQSCVKIKQQSQPISKQNDQPHNQLRNTAGTSDVIYTYRNSPMLTELSISANYGGACAAKTYASVSYFSRSKPFVLTDYPSVISDIQKAVQQRCPQTNDIMFIFGGKQPGKPREKLRYYQSSQHNGWKITAIADPLDAYPVDEAVLFTEGRLEVDKKNNTVHGLLLSFGPPMKFKGTYEDFKVTDPGATVRVDYTITGKYYGYGDAKKKCKTPRDGYAYWGSFKLLGEKAQMTLYRCTDDYEDHKKPVKFDTLKLVWTKKRKDGVGFATVVNPAVFRNRFNPAIGSVIHGDPELQRARAQAKHEAAMKLELAEERRRVKPNLVYKTKQYWIGTLGRMDGYNLKHEDQKKIVIALKNTFDGVFNAKQPDVSAYNFALTYRAYVQAYGRHCRAYLKQPLKITEMLNRIDKHGVVHKDKRPGIFYIEKRFYETYDAYRATEVRYFTDTAMSIVSRGGSMGSIYTAATIYPETINAVISSIPCDSATMRQLNENMWRKAHGKSSLQSAGGSIKGSEKETEAKKLGL